MISGFDSWLINVARLHSFREHYITTYINYTLAIYHTQCTAIIATDVKLHMVF